MSASAVYQRIWYEKNKAKLQPLRAARTAEKRAAMKEMVNEIKSLRGCQDCGRTYDPVVLDFHHVRGEKVSNVAQMLNSYGRKRVLEEIAKCEVVCANCHRLRHGPK